jgi:hypothetical protein
LPLSHLRLKSLYTSLAAIFHVERISILSAT